MMKIISNNISILLFLAIIPIILILLFVYYKDKNKEPFKLLFKLFITGQLSCGIVVILSSILEGVFPVFSPTASKNFYEVLMYAFIGVAFVEEITKWSMVYLIGYHNKEFDEVYDGLVYAVFVSLGFAFIENIIYVIANNSIYTALIRALCAIPSHTCDAIFMGYHLSIAKIHKTKGNKKKELLHLLLSIIMPTLLHGIYDYCLLSGFKILIIVFMVFIVIMYYMSIVKLNDMSNKKTKIGEKKRICPYCGTFMNNNTCNHCNNKHIRFMFIKNKQKEV